MEDTNQPPLANDISTGSPGGPTSTPRTKGSLHREIKRVLNRHSAENGSNTPDFILAAFLMSCLEAFDAATNGRAQWCGPKRQSAIETYTELLQLERTRLMNPDPT